ncbi:hypothetical protein [Labrenzia sp. OB1]|uniref:hypothetical protein n=1 Tax=Labrenzia sp. OB1 TaxID=1561204 RepID=UPI000AE24E74|nr:hypothetical protein [Labrenzia sp. OB1]
MSAIDPASFEHSVFARTLFDGQSPEPRHNQLIGIVQGRIVHVSEATQAMATELGATIADVATPGLIDLQINGANDTQFNFEPTVDALSRIAEGARKGGTAHIMRGGSVCLNSFGRFAKWISASIMPPPSSAPAL